MLSRQREGELLVMVQSPDTREAALVELLEWFDPLLRRIVWRLTSGGWSADFVEEMRSEVRLAFLNAVQQFDTKRKTRLSTLVMLLARRHVVAAMRAACRGPVIEPFDESASEVAQPEDPDAAGGADTRTQLLRSVLRSRLEQVKNDPRYTRKRKRYFAALLAGEDFPDKSKRFRMFRRKAEKWLREATQ